MTTLSGVLLGLLVVGYNPYLSNTFRYGHPFYPIYGSNTLNKEFILQNQMPPDFEGMGWMEKLFCSLFSSSQNVIGKEVGSLKFPLSVKRSEIIAFARPDVRISGWGPFFGALVILSLVSLTVLAFISRKVALFACVLIGLVIALSSLNSEAWWARYTPQIWLIPVIILGALWFAEDKRTNIMGNVLALLMFANIFSRLRSLYRLEYSEIKRIESHPGRIATKRPKSHAILWTFRGSGLANGKLWHSIPKSGTARRPSLPDTA